MTNRLHHMAFRCRDTEATRAFYEEVIGLPLAAALPIGATATGREVRVLHSFFALRDGSYVAFFEAPDAPFDFVDRHDFDLHLALEAEPEDVERATAEARRRGLEVRGPSDHGMIASTYFRDPDGYVVELAVKTAAHAEFDRDEPARAREVLAAWVERRKAPAPV
ncbi:VOC family protein [Phenylobacterium soli]|uniref:VOC family protein n=1 Tax=Phenylobacterium soli TaxID=2170551 RepID=A0A328AK97_9CAUL|nr:VOC family protein [Phenylobacterium soli]RAK53298.1 VOC family protein [Phenylobacterium soli]